MTDCKHCKMTDEYCASGDCPTSQSPRNDLATKPQVVDLTEQWRKGELPSGWYYVDYYSVDGAVMLEYLPQHNGFGYDEKNLVQAVLTEVPSYDEWKASYNCMLENEVLRLKNTELKELLKECKEVFDTVFSPSVKYGELYKQIDEVLK